MQKLVIEHFRERIRKGEYSTRQPKPLPVEAKGKLLEIGCGLALTYSSNEMEAYAIDVVREMIRLLKKSHRDAHVITADINMLPFRQDCFNVVVSTSLLHHLIGNTPAESKHKAANAIQEIKRVLKLNGILLMHEDVATNHLISLGMFYVTLFCAKFGIEINSLDIHSKVVTSYLTEKTLTKCFQQNGFYIRKKTSVDWIFKRIKLGKTIRFLCYSL